MAVASNFNDNVSNTVCCRPVINVVRSADCFSRIKKLAYLQKAHSYPIMHYAWWTLTENFSYTIGRTIAVSHKKILRHHALNCTTTIIIIIIIIITIIA